MTMRSSIAYFGNRYLLRRPFLVARVPEFNLEFKFKTEDAVGRQIYKRGTYEETLTRFILDNAGLGSGDVAIDAGANLGWYSLLLARAFPEAQVLAFEPDPLNFQLLERNVKHNDAHNICCINKAVSDAEGMATLHLYPDKNRGRHSLNPINEGESIQVPVTTIDATWEAHGLADRLPRVMKLDIEGHELRALNGASRVLARCPLIISEFSPGYMRQGGDDPKDLFALMSDIGRAPFILDSSGLRPADSDALCNIQYSVDLIWK